MSPARDVAFRVLRRVHGGGHASDLLRHESQSLDARDAALAEAIVLGSLRYQAQLDYLIAHFSGRPRPKLDEEVRIALRMGIYQLRYLDRILIDAPCSGTGTLTRNPEIKWRLQPTDLAGFHRRQRKMVEQALELLKPGGRMVYSTCSLEIEENEDVVAGLPVLETHLRLPGRDAGDGFFSAVLALV